MSAQSQENVVKSPELFKRITKAFYGGASRARLYRKLDSLMKNGQRLQVALENLYSRAKRRSSSDPEAIFLAEAILALRAGKSFSAGIKRYIPVSEMMVLKAGERSGDLRASLMLCSEMIEATAKMRSAVLGSMAEPIVTLLIVIISIYVIGKMVIPQLAMAMDPTKWTGIAKSLYLISQMVNSPFAVIPAILILAGSILIYVSLPRWKSKLRVYADRIPPWSFYRLLIGGGWLISLSALIKSGVTLTEAVEQLKVGASPWLYERLERTLVYMRAGKNLGLALEATKYEFPDMEIVDDLVSYSELPNFDTILYNLGRSWIEHGLEKIQEQAAVMSVVGRLIVGVFIIWFSYGTIQIQNQIGDYFMKGMAGF